MIRGKVRWICIILHSQQQQHWVSEPKDRPTTCRSSPGFRKIPLAFVRILLRNFKTHRRRQRIAMNEAPTLTKEE